MKWVGVYLRDAHQRFIDNISGDLDWTLSDTCMIPQIAAIRFILNTVQIMLKRSAHTRLLLSAFRTGAGSSPTKNGKDTNMLLMLHFKLVPDSHLPSVEPSASVC